MLPELHYCFILQKVFSGRTDAAGGIEGGGIGEGMAEKAECWTTVIVPGVGGVLVALLFGVEEILLERLRPLGVPLVTGLPVGHGLPNLALPLGRRARLDGQSGSLLLL